MSEAPQRPRGPDAAGSPGERSSPRVALRADYERRAQSLLIELVPEEELYGVDDTVELPGGCYVALNPAGRPLSMQVLGPPTNLPEVPRRRGALLARRRRR